MALIRIAKYDYRSKSTMASSTRLKYGRTSQVMNLGKVEYIHNIDETIFFRNRTKLNIHRTRILEASTELS